jgi:hypothetical protein
MKFDISELRVEEQLRFLNLIKHNPPPEDGYYKVFINRKTGEFLLSKIDYVMG